VGYTPELHPSYPGSNPCQGNLQKKDHQQFTFIEQSFARQTLTMSKKGQSEIAKLTVNACK